MEYLLYLWAFGAFINMFIQAFWLYIYLKDRKKWHLEQISYNTFNISKNTYKWN